MPGIEVVYRKSEGTIYSYLISIEMDVGINVTLLVMICFYGMKGKVFYGTGI